MCVQCICQSTHLPKRHHCVVTQFHATPIQSWGMPADNDVVKIACADRGNFVLVCRHWSVCVCSSDILIGPNTLELMSEALADCKTMELLWALSKLLRRASSSIHQIGIQWNEQKTGKELFCAVKKIDWSQKHISWHIAYVLCVCLPTYINKQSPFYLSVLVLWLIFFSLLLCHGDAHFIPMLVVHASGSSLSVLCRRRNHVGAECGMYESLFVR